MDLLQATAKWQSTSFALGILLNDYLEGAVFNDELLLVINVKVNKK